MISYKDGELRYQKDPIIAYRKKDLVEKFKYVIYNDRYVIGKMYGDKIKLSYRNEEELYYYTCMTLDELKVETGKEDIEFDW